MTETRYLTTEHLVVIAEYATGAEPAIRDRGLLASAANRPASTMFGEEPCPTLWDTAAAVMHSIARFHPLVDGNKRLAWTAAAAFCEFNGAQVVATNDEAYEFTMAVARGQYDDARSIAKALEALVNTTSSRPA